MKEPLQHLYSWTIGSDDRCGKVTITTGWAVAANDDEASGIALRQFAAECPKLPMDIIFVMRAPLTLAELYGEPK